MGALIDMSGQRFGRLTAVARTGTLGAQAAWECICDCGSTVVVRGPALRKGNTRSCGCLKTEMTSQMGRSRRIPVEGRRFGSIRILGRSESDPRLLEYECDCGRTGAAGTGKLHENSACRSCAASRAIARKRLAEHLDALYGQLKD